MMDKRSYADRLETSWPWFNEDLVGELMNRLTGAQLARLRSQLREAKVLAERQLAKDLLSLPTRARKARLEQLVEEA